jgi:hypothetical protein
MADQSVTPGTATQTFNAGLYRSVSVAGDADLVAANIATGVQIFSVIGTAALRPADCSTNGTVGCYTTSTYKSADVTNLAAGNIKTGVTIAGTAGSVIEESHSPCTSEVENCVSNATYKAAYTTGLAPKIIAGNTVAGILGTYTPPTVLNVKKGVTFGVTGSLQTGTYPDVGNELAGATGANDLDTFAGTTGSGTYEWFTPAGVLKSGTIEANATITPATTAQTVNTGLYRSVTVSAVNSSIDASIAAGNIKSGITILGVAGNVVQESHITCTIDSETGCVTDTNYKAAKMANFISGDVKTGVTIAGVAGGATLETHSACGANGVGALGSCYTTDAYKSADFTNLVAGNIKSGVTIAGVAGTLALKDLLGSGAHRDRGVPQMTYAQEIAYGTAIWRTLNAGAGIGYREVPLLAKDDDGALGSTNLVTKLGRSGGSWSGLTTTVRKVCGKLATSVADKITACEDALKGNPTATPWNGSANGISGEGSWTLVTVYNATLNEGDTCGTTTSTCYEVWRDDRTGLLWSDQLADSVGGSTTYNWCKATGSNFSSDTGNPYREDDPWNCCDSATYQNQAQTPTPPVSMCFEDSAWLSTPTTADPMKGNMHKHSGASGTVKWRLPTIQDYKVADHNGIRHVLPNIAIYFWSASVVSNSSDLAWQFDGYYGYLSSPSRLNTSSAARCVGSE